MSHCSEGEKGCTPKRSHNANGSKTVAGKNIGKTDGALPCSGRREESSGKACFPPVLPMRSSYATSILGHAKKREPNRSPFVVRFRPPSAESGSPTRQQAPRMPNGSRASTTRPYAQTATSSRISRLARNPCLGVTPGTSRASS